MACALRAAELGKKVALIEKDKVGGMCLHQGCIPLRRSGELIAEGQLIYIWETLPSEVAQLIHPHPTQSEPSARLTWRSPRSPCTSMPDRARACH